ncbi:MAG: Zn-dependent hydrolase [Ectothiorhodospiraceae bacterium]|nr:Zn-dependent hydrolase [Ectothiorhodospiraceae bacterium]
MSRGANRLRVDGARLWSTIARSAEIGPGRADGLCRLPLTDADRQMRDQFVQWCRDAGCSITVDRVGNIFARRAGSDDTLAPVLIGSHLDTQVAGGRYDGILGVLAGLEVVRTLNDAGQVTRRPIEVVCWTNEEGARFQPPMMCSAAFAGVLDVDWVLACTDDDGLVFGEELERIGYAGEAPVGGRAVDAYFELHIEQGPELEAADLPLGIVTAGYFTRGLRVEVTGETAHAGPTPMDRRRNALVGAAMMIVAANEIGWAWHDTGGKSTSTRIKVWPNKPGILPDWAEVTFDFRHPEQGATLEMESRMRAAIEDACRRARVEASITQTWEFGSEVFDPECVAMVESAAAELGVPCQRMRSQAGHDAYHMTRVAPTALLFCPCRDGVSHNEAEHVEQRDAVPSVDVLLHAVLARADR